MVISLVSWKRGQENKQKTILRKKKNLCICVTTLNKLVVVVQSSSSSNSLSGFEEVSETSDMVAHSFAEVFLEVLTGNSVELGKNLNQKNKKTKKKTKLLLYQTVIVTIHNFSERDLPVLCIKHVFLFLTSVYMETSAAPQEKQKSILSVSLAKHSKNVSKI